MKGFKVNPHRMGRIGEPAVGEGICGEEITEFVIDHRWRDRQDGKHGGAPGESRNPNHHDGGFALPSEGTKAPFDGAKEARTDFMICEGEGDCRQHKIDLNLRGLSEHRRGPGGRNPRTRGA